VNRRSVLQGAGGVLIASQLGFAKAATTVLPQQVLFLHAHDDDNLLGCGVRMAEHADDPGVLEVHSSTFTRGGKTGAIDTLNGKNVSGWWGKVHVPSQEYPIKPDGTYDLTVDDIMAARVAEGNSATRALWSGSTSASAGKTKIWRADETELGSVASGYANSLLDGFGGPGNVCTTDAFNAARSVIQSLITQIVGTGPIRLQGHSYLDPDTDHQAIGKAMQWLKAHDSRVVDVTYCLRPMYWSQTATLLKGIPFAYDLPDNATITARIMEAIKCFGAFNPYLGAYAVGEHSVPGDFTKLAATPKTLYHHV
jgi:hypothetical protein